MSPEGNPWPASRTFALGYAVAIAALTFNSIYTLYNLNIISHSWSAVVASQEVLAGLDDMLASVMDAEAGQRGYLLTGDERYLDPYTRSHPVVAAAIDRLRSIAGRDARRQEQVQALAAAADVKLAELAETIRLRKEGGVAPALAVVRSDRGKQAMDTIRRLIAAIRSDEAVSRGRLQARLHAAIRMTTLTFLLASAAVLALLLGVHLLGERSRRALGRYAAWLATTLRSIGDGVITTDDAGRITFLNPVAESLTGWPREEATGKPLEQVLRIANQHTGEPAENPVAKVLRDGVVVGLANHTVLTARDGTARPIDDSAAPITDDDGRVHGVVLVFHDVSDKHAAEESLREAGRARRSAEAERRRADETARLLAAIVESSDDAVISKSLDGIITSWNAAAERIFGYTAAEVVGKPISVLMPPEHAEDANRILHHIRRGERVEHFETQRVTKDGRLIAVSLTVSPIRDADGTIVGASKIARDITARRQAEAERERLLAAAEAARAQAESANRTKDEFLAVLSHELRTPLNAILGWAKILRSGKVDADDVEQGLAAIERNSHAQALIIEDLLDLSRIISGKLRLEVQRLHLADIIEAAIAAVMPAAEAKGIRVHKVLDSLAGPVTGDPARLQQVVWNLLANAVKFTPKGGKVQVFLERVNSHVEITVTDTGIGIKPEFLPHVFDRFQQADSTTTRRHGGLGLGLSIVKQLVEMHGGTVRAKSPGEGQGSTFAVTLPITVVHPGQPDARRARPPAADAEEDICQDGALAGLKVLVVDDEPDARQLLHHVLADCQAEVSLAASAAEALEQLERFRPDVIVSDIGMPEMDGYDLIRRVRATFTARQIPAAALTAFAHSEDRKRALLAGFQTHIAKPVDPAELTAAVASLACRTATSDSHHGGSP